MLDYSFSLYEMVQIVWFLCCLIFTLSKTSDAFSFDPPSKSIEVIEGNTYIFGIDEIGDTLITRCYYKNDLGEEGVFDVGVSSIESVSQKNKSEYELERKGNVISDLGIEGLPKIKVEYVTDAGPKKWDLAAYDSQNKVFINATFNVVFFYRAGIVTRNIITLEDSGFLNHLSLGNHRATTCTLKFKDSNLNLDLTSMRKPTAVENNNENTISRMVSLGRRLCGFTLQHTSIEFENDVTWSLTAKDERGISFREEFTTKIEAKETNYVKPQIVEASLGNPIQFKCPFLSSPSMYCQLFDPNGNLTSINCQHSIDIVLDQHIGKWKCVGGGKYLVDGIEGIETIIELVENHKTEWVSKWYKEEEDVVNIGCKLENPEKDHKHLIYCKFTSPDLKFYQVNDFLASERFSSLGTNQSDSKCSLQIQKPLLKSEEGVWGCELGVKAGVVTGTLILVGNTPASIKRDTEVATTVGKSATVMCQVPFNSDYCSITAPNGTTFRNLDINSIRLGRCAYHIPKVSNVDDGIWTCNFASETYGRPDEIVRVRLSVAGVLHYDERVELDEGDDAHLLCSSNTLALRYCRFVSPTDVGYQIYDKASTERITYHGQGLLRGDCGIRISGVRPDETGTWTCEAQLLYDGAEVIKGSIHMEVVARSSNSLASVGIGLGAAAIIIAVVGGLYWVRKKRQQPRQPTLSLSPDESPNESLRTSRVNRLELTQP